ncbi:sensor histidine kinase [Microlunatus soli]|uniref:histidine kinase n=1 Tax=Microlunatus soli TaxID=630515 RepID=A0A1H1V4M0_9ACTN|nr:HAMP domain-containing sensor histidine kinase [Microlunatus soli]SDS79678.1 two-component system, OmpR family, sensor histidine kinase MprB [Microlunatus soli]
MADNDPGREEPGRETAGRDIAGRDEPSRDDSTGDDLERWGPPEPRVLRIRGTQLVIPGSLILRFRSFLRTFSLQTRVTVLTAVAVALAVAVTGAAAYLTTRVALYQQLDSGLLDLATTVATSVGDDPQNLDETTAAAVRAANASAALIRADGQVYQLPQEQIALQPGPEELSVARLGSSRSVRSATASNGEPYRVVAVPVPNSELALVLGRPLRPTNLVLSSLWLVLVIFGAAGVVWAAIAGSAVARSGLRPVRRLTAATEHVADTDDLDPIPVTGNDELSRLAESFNKMLTSLEQSRERQRRLIGDAGHELRTPLTSLRTNIELLQADQKQGHLPEQARAEILADVTAQLAEFTSLIGDLVQLARDDQVKPAPEPIDFRDVVNAALERVRRRGPGLKFDVELNPFYLVGEADTLERAVTNLLDNAVKWSPPGGTVRVQLEGDRLRVADEGSGIAEQDLPHIFDRFYRADTSRNTPGTGLGLSIVAQAVARHGGTIRAGRSAQGGAEFTVRLPGSTDFESLRVD